MDLSCFSIPSAIALTAVLACSAPTCRAQAADNPLKLNQIQVIGTHNSYHAGIAPNESKIWQAKYADAYKGLDYQHQPLPQQFDSGVRQIELDVYADTKGGLYAHPSGPSMVAAAKLPPDPDFDPNGVMTKPGFKVMHVQDIDYRSTCQPFIACLEQIRQWLAIARQDLQAHALRAVLADDRRRARRSALARRHSFKDHGSDRAHRIGGSHRSARRPNR